MAKKDDALDALISKNRQGAPMVEDMHAGVTVSWLCQVFHMDPKVVKQRLADCPPLHRRKAGYVYDLAQAARYLVPPAMSPEQFVKTMKASDLPPHFQQTFWDAALKRQKWEENAGQLWRTEKVREVLGDTFQTIKFTIQLWAETVERETGLTSDQRTALVKLTDSLQQEIYDRLVEQASAKNTGSQRSELPDMIGPDDMLPTFTVEDDEDDMEEAMSLV